MLIYPVPFSAKEEEKLIFNLNTREVLVMSSGIGLGIIASAILAAALNTFIIYCIPLAIPFVGVAFLLAFIKVNRAGATLTLNEYALRKLKYNNRSRHYLRYRKLEVDK